VFTLIIGALWFVAFAWLVIVVLTLHGLSRQRHLLATSDLQLTPSAAPLVSILVPARNEEQRVLEACIRSILAQDYGQFEVIAVDDRSTDNTGAILKTLAQSDERLTVIEGAELPPGWLGKPYAMQQALNHARGEWILATDADMIFQAAALRTALDRALENNADALTFIPRFETGSFWERVMIPTWEWVFLMFTIVYRVNDPKSDRGAGIGGFFLVRRTVLERAGGYEGLKDEVMEDVRLAERIKRLGARLMIDRAPRFGGKLQAYNGMLRAQRLQMGVQHSEERLHIRGRRGDGKRFLVRLAAFAAQSQSQFLRDPVHHFQTHEQLFQKTPQDK